MYQRSVKVCQGDAGTKGTLMLQADAVLCCARTQDRLSGAHQWLPTPRQLC